MKQFFSHHKIYRGIQLKITFLAKTKKAAAELCDVSSHIITQWYNSVEYNAEKYPLLKENEIWATFDSGELCYVYPDKRDVYMPIDELKVLIDKHRETCKTYHETIEKYSK
jgi:hypothetical protein